MNAAKTDPTKPPTTLGIDLRWIPEVLREIPQWVTWKWEWRVDKWTKPLYNARTGAPASVDPESKSWSTVKEAYQTYRQNKDEYAGIGIVLTENLGLVAIDLDDCVEMIDKTEAKIEQWAQDIVDRFPTYWEISPSGTGLRGIGRGKLTRPGRRRGKIEVYDRLRYVTLTGQSNTSNPVADIQVALDRWHREVWPDPPPPRASAPAGTGSGTGNGIPDDQLLQRARNAANGDEFRALYDGDPQAIIGKDKPYPSQSEADLALVSKLMFWTNGDTARVDQLFRQSRLMREKWDRQDYREGTIAMARQGFEGGFGAEEQAPEDGPTFTYTEKDFEDPIFNDPPPSADDFAEDDPYWGGLGTFLGKTFPPVTPIIPGMLSNDGGGWIGGEEKLMKTYYSLEEGLGLALQLQICGKFTVVERQRVLYVQEEDSPQRTQARIRAILRGHGLDPDDPAVRADLDAWFSLSVWAGFSFDKPSMMQRLARKIERFKPTVVYIDCLRKVTLTDFNKAEFASKITGTLDDLRRQFGILPRVVHHYRKTQGRGGRAGRGSQEIGGSFVFGAWGENSLFFEPIGRKVRDKVKVEIQSKDMGGSGFILRIDVENEADERTPRVVRFTAEQEKETSIDQTATEILGEMRAAAALARGGISTPSWLTGVKGGQGMTLIGIVNTTGKSESTVRRALRQLKDDGKAGVIDTLTGGAKLYAEFTDGAAS